MLFAGGRSCNWYVGTPRAGDPEPHVDTVAPVAPIKTSCCDIETFSLDALLGSISCQLATSRIPSPLRSY
ncbi:hypothetical protein CBR_g34487 [Chara braunii]|uniref:Uncharacterized protein n=1 Tax=Chara braunii TaxID=69332 RepID=A0A388LIP8_CHABU|nr:hypothetical protein CBR_g34487 [Chara braunii]|eukprot:GBG82204.1 hypothetical protein CBR_g34487 [Chara braunii]